MSAKTIAFAPRRKGGDAPLVINADTIRYIQMKRNYAEVHLTNGAVFTSRITMEELEQRLGDDFIKVHRSCLVAVRAIHSVENTESSWNMWCGRKSGYWSSCKHSKSG